MNPETQNERMEESTEIETGMDLNIDAWKQKGDTYSSLLDVYGVPDLFAEERMAQYEEIQNQKKQQDKELAAYLFSGDKKAEEDNSAAIVEVMFAKELSFAKNKNYELGDGNRMGFSFVLTGFIVILFVLIMLRYQLYRKAKRKKYVDEIDVEIK